MKNRYCKSSKLSERQFRALVKCFSVDLTATQAARMTGLNRNTVNRYLRLIRGRIAARCERESPFAGTVEVDESYFGARRVRGKRGRGATDKTPVFGIFERGGRVYTEVVPNCKKATLQAIIRGKIAPDSLVNSDGWRGYDGLVDMGYEAATGNPPPPSCVEPDPDETAQWQDQDMVEGHLRDFLGG
jgi:transposase